jgi:thiosulfate/3-mercaptopyruvate sulfurtransferase
MKNFRFAVTARKPAQNLAFLNGLLLFLLIAGGFTTGNLFAQTAADDQKTLDSYFVSVDWLKANLGKVIILDARNKAAYDKEHISGAVNKHWQEFSNVKVKQSEPGWGIIFSQDELAKIFGTLGIDGSKAVVVYNDPLSGSGEEGRNLWALRVFGLKNTYILNGGLKAWKAAGGAVSTQSVTLKPVVLKAPARDESLFASTSYVAANLGKINILDARSTDEYTGKNSGGAVAAGHIPGAIHYEYKNLYNADGTIKSPRELRTLFAGLGISRDKDTVSYCTAGIRSGIETVALWLAGYNNAKNYDGSFSEWTATNQRVER